SLNGLLAVAAALGILRNWPGHWGRLEKLAVVDHPRISGAFEFREQSFPQVFHNLGIFGIVRHVVHLMGILFEIEQFLARSFAVGVFEVLFPLWIVAVLHDPRLGGAGVFIGQGDESRFR